MRKFKEIPETSSQNSETHLSYEQLNDMSSKFGNNFFVFYPRILVNNFENMRSAFSQFFDFKIGYSFKTNYTPYVVKVLCELGAVPEIVSEFEFDLVKRLNLKTDMVIVNGPIKTEGLFNALQAYREGIINIESLSDLQLAKRAKKEINYGIRCNFGDNLPTGKKSRFGIDVNSVVFDQCLDYFGENNRKFGLHVHLPMRDLKSFEARALKLKEVILERELKLEFLNLGGGMMSPMPSGFASYFRLKKVAYLDYAKAINDILGPIRDLFNNKLIIEPGTALVANAFDYFSKVKEIKEISGENFAQLHGSTFDIKGGVREIRVPFDILSPELSGEAKECSRVVGYTCIENDEFIFEGIRPIQSNSIIAIRSVGSYSIQMKPPFINFSPPIVLYQDKKFHLIKRRETVDDILRTYL